MKIRVTLTTDSGEIFDGEVSLTSRGSAAGARKAKQSTSRITARVGPDVSVPLRPFLRGQARGRSGAAKLTLLIAHLSGGKIDVEVDSGDVQRAWNRATAFLGEYNRAHATRAKDNGWIDSPRHGVYKLRKSWVDAG